MKSLIITIILAGTMASCSTSESQKSSANQTAGVSPSPVITPQVHITPPVNTERSEATPLAETTTAAPVEFTYTGVTPDKESISYRIRVSTPRPIKQVDIGIKYLDAKGAVISETTRAWQNIVKSKKEPIEQGKTYEVTDDLEEGSTKAECKLKRVFFADGTNWSAP